MTLKSQQTYRELVHSLGVQDIRLTKADPYHPPKEDFPVGARLGDYNGAQALRIDRTYGLINDVFSAPKVRVKLMIPGFDGSSCVGSTGSLSLAFNIGHSLINRPDLLRLYRVSPLHFGLVAVHFKGRGDDYSNFGISLCGQSIYHEPDAMPVPIETSGHDPFGPRFAFDTTNLFNAVSAELVNLSRNYRPLVVFDSVASNFFGEEAEAPPVSFNDARRFVEGNIERILSACDYPGFRRDSGYSQSSNVVPLFPRMR